jgi:hypothetical protein
VIPAWDAASRHSIRIAADPARVYEIASHADLGRPPLVRMLMALRIAPAWLASAVLGPPARLPACPPGFTLVAESPGDEFVLGIMGRFWTPTGGLVPATPDQFRQPPPSGLAQGFWNFRVEAVGSGTLLTTETRVRCGDPATRRSFARYWRVIRLGSGLIRGSLLRHIRQQAERAP